MTLDDAFHPPRLWARLLETAASLPERSDVRRECVVAARAVREADEADRRVALAGIEERAEQERSGAT